MRLGEHDLTSSLESHIDITPEMILIHPEFGEYRIALKPASTISLTYVVIQCWLDNGPAVKRRWFDVLCSLGSSNGFLYIFLEHSHKLVAHGTNFKKC